MLFAACSRQYVDNSFAFQTIQVVGVGKSGIEKHHASGYSSERSEMMRLLDSKMAAYQDLSDQLLATVLPNHRTVSEQLNVSEQYRPLVDVLIRQAKVVSISTTPGGGFETCLSLAIKADSVGCLMGSVKDLAECRENLQGSNSNKLSNSAHSVGNGSCYGDFCYPYPIVGGYIQ